MKKLLSLLSVVSMLFVAVPADASIQLDQAYDTLGNTTFSAPSANFWQQSVTAGLTGELSKIEFHAARNGGDFNISVNEGAGWQSDTNDFEIVYSAVVGWNTIDVSSAGLQVSSGSQFVIGINGIDADLYVPGGSPGPYSGGSTYLNGSEFAGGSFDLNFRTYVNAVPEPTTAVIWLMFAGVGMLAYRRRQ